MEMAAQLAAQSAQPAALPTDVALATLLPSQPFDLHVE
jgi:hypothetical protein